MSIVQAYCSLPSFDAPSISLVALRANLEEGHEQSANECAPHREPEYGCKGLDGIVGIVSRA
jgi:hypothetical protein